MSPHTVNFFLRKTQRETKTEEDRRRRGDAYRIVLKLLGTVEGYCI